METADITITENQGVALLVNDSGVDKSKAQFILEKFESFFKQAAEWESKAKELVITDASQTAEMKMARQARLALRDIRIEADKARKAMKEGALREGNLIQGIYNIIEGVISPIEKHLEEQEKFVQIQEENRRVQLRADRLEQLSKYMDNPDMYPLGEISEQAFQDLLNGAKLQYEAKIEALHKAEEDRIAREKAEAEERERIRLENERLKNEAIERDRIETEKKALRQKRSEELKPYIVFIRDYNALIEKEENEYQSELSEIKKGAELQWENDRKEEARREQERREQEEKLLIEQKKLELERKEKERIEAELRAKKEAEQKAEADNLAAIEAELNKGDKQKFDDMINELEAIKNKYIFKSKKYKGIQTSVIDLINKTINYATSKT